MAKKQSKLILFFLYPLFVLVFLVVAYFMAVSAMGYRYTLNFQNGKIGKERTGAIIFSSRPGDASIFVNDTKSDSNTPVFSFLTAQIGNLNPGNYRIRIEKAGYENWAAIINVEPGLVSWATQVLLLPTVRTASAYNMPPTIESTIASPDSSRELVITNDKTNQAIAAWQINTTNKTRISLFEKRLLDGESYRPLMYSNDNQMILFEHTLSGKKTYVAFEAVNNGTSYDLNNIFKSDFDSYTFNPRNHNELFALRSGDLFKLSLSAKTQSGVLFSNVIGIYPEGTGSLVFIQKNNNLVNLYRLDSNDGQTLVVRGLTDSSSYAVSFMTNDFGYAVLPNSTRTLVVYLPNGNPDVSPKKIADNVDFILPSSKDQFLGYGNKDSFYCYDNEHLKYYTTYTGRQVSSIVWFNDQYNLAYIENGNLKMITYAGFYDKNIFTASNDFPVVANPNGPRLFYVATNPSKKELDLFSFDFNT